MAIAMHSDRMKPFAPTNVGILPRGFSFRYSSGACWDEVIVTRSSGRLEALATARMAVERGLNCGPCQRCGLKVLQKMNHHTGRVYRIPKAMMEKCGWKC